MKQITIDLKTESIHTFTIEVADDFNLDEAMIDWASLTPIHEYTQVLEATEIYANEQKLEDYEAREFFQEFSHLVPGDVSFYL